MSSTVQYVDALGALRVPSSKYKDMSKARTHGFDAKVREN